MTIKCDKCGVAMWEGELGVAFDPSSGPEAAMGKTWTAHIVDSPDCLRRQVEQKDERIAALELIVGRLAGWAFTWGGVTVQGSKHDRACNGELHAICQAAGDTIEAGTPKLEYLVKNAPELIILPGIPGAVLQMLAGVGTYEFADKEALAACAAWPELLAICKRLAAWSNKWPRTEQYPMDTAEERHGELYAIEDEAIAAIAKAGGEDR